MSWHSERKDSGSRWGSSANLNASLMGTPKRTQCDGGGHVMRGSNTTNRSNTKQCIVFPHFPCKYTVKSWNTRDVFFSLQINHNGHSSAAQMAVAKGDASHIEVAWMQKDNKCDVISKFGMLSFCFRFGLLSFAMATEFRGDCGWYAGWSPSICGFASLLFCQYSSCRRCCHLQTGSSSNPATYKEAQLHISSDLDSFRTSWTCSFQLQEKHWI